MEEIALHLRKEVNELRLLQGNGKWKSVLFKQKSYKHLTGETIIRSEKRLEIRNENSIYRGRIAPASADFTGDNV